MDKKAKNLTNNFDIESLYAATKCIFHQARVGSSVLRRQVAKMYDPAIALYELSITSVQSLAILLPRDVKRSFSICMAFKPDRRTSSIFRRTILRVSERWWTAG